MQLVGGRASTQYSRGYDHCMVIIGSNTQSEPGILNAPREMVPSLITTCALCPSYSSFWHSGRSWDGEDGSRGARRCLIPLKDPVVLCFHLCSPSVLGLWGTLSGRKLQMSLPGAAQPQRILYVSALHCGVFL